MSLSRLVVISRALSQEKMSENRHKRLQDLLQLLVLETLAHHKMSSA
jgi:hypothetical protein